MRLIALLSLVPVAIASVCHICGSKGNDGLTDPYYVVNGRTCVDITMHVAMRARPGSNYCKQATSRYGPKCCDINSTTPQQKPNKTSPYVPYEGPYRPCHICRNGNYPENEGMVINFLYLGADSCARYYEHGLSGRLIPNYLCSVVQYFAFDPCGCESKQ